MVQWFYAHRLAVLSKSRTLPLVIVLVSHLKIYKHLGRPWMLHLPQISTISYAGALASGIIAKHANRVSELLAYHRSQIFTTTGVRFANFPLGEYNTAC